MIYTPVLDRMQVVTGTYDGGTNKTTWIPAYLDHDIDTVVLGDSFGASAGTVLSVVYQSGSFKKTGDYSAGSVIMGISFDPSITLGEPFVLDRNGIPYFPGERQVRHVDVAYDDSGPFTVKGTWPSGGAYERMRPFAPTTSDGVSATGYFRARLNGHSKRQVVSIYTTEPKRMQIVGVTYELDNNTRRD